MPSTPTEPSKRWTLAGLLRPYVWQIGLGALLLLVTNGLDKAIPWLLKQAVDALRNASFDDVQRHAVWVVAIAALMWMVRTASRLVIFNVGRRVEFDLRNALVDKLSRIEESAAARFSGGEFMSRATGDLGHVRGLIGFGGLNVVNTVFAYTLALGLMLTLSVELTLWALVPYPGFVLATRFLGRALFSRSRAIQETAGELASEAEGFVEAVRMQRVYGLDTWQAQRFAQVNELLLARNLRLVKLRAVLWPLLSALTAAGTLMVIWRGGNMVLEGQLTVGEFVAFSAYVGQLVWPSMALGFLLAVVQRGRAGFSRLREVLESPEIAAPTAQLSDAQLSRPESLTLADVAHQYGDQPVLAPLRLSLPGTGLVAVVGKSGSGKSTLAKIVAGRLQPSAGHVLVGETRLDALAEADVARLVAYVSQHPVLFSTTLRRNLQLVRTPAPGDGELQVALQRAALEKDLGVFPQRLETLVGERGVQLSGGQRQRLTLSRAWLQGAPVMVLDDPVSAVDTETEKAIVDALVAHAHNHLILLVTHRVSAAARADRIVVLDGGRIVGDGSHATLMSHVPVYRELADRQQMEAALREVAS